MDSTLNSSSSSISSTATQQHRWPDIGDDDGGGGGGGGYIDPTAVASMAAMTAHSLLIGRHLSLNASLGGGADESLSNQTVPLLVRAAAAEGDADDRDYIFDQLNIKIIFIVCYVAVFVCCVFGEWY